MASSKQRIVGLIMIVVGIAGFFWQLNILRESFYFYKIGAIFSVLVVLGIAIVIMGTTGLMDRDENGERRQSFGDFPLKWKIVLGLSIVTGIANLIYFDFGAPGML